MTMPIALLLAALQELHAPAPSLGLAIPQGGDNQPPEGFTALFNGKDLAGWKVPEGDNGHWRVHGGVIEYDGKSEAKGDKHLWAERSFRDFVLMVSWRFPGKAVPEDHPVFDADGNEIKGPDGKVKTERMMDAGDSGVYLRGSKRIQANLFCYPCGSGEFWQVRTNPKLPPEVRKGVMPKKRADKPPGEWNQMTITMKGDRVTVVLNGEEVISNAALPEVPAEGPVGFQHEHGSLQFKNVYVRELK
jgi:hypothetical protein